MFSRFTQAAALTLLLAAAPATLSSQQAQQQRAAAPQPDVQLQQQVQGWLAEMQQIHGQLEQLQARALQDPQLSAAQSALGESIKTAMQRIDPTLERSLVRVQALETEAEAAQQAGDQTKLQQLGAEVQQIQQKFVAAQQQALQQPELATRVQSFQQQLEAKMTQLDPTAEDLIARFQQLEMQLMSVMQEQG